MDFKQIGPALKPKTLSSDSLYLDKENPRFFGDKFQIAKAADPLDDKVQERIRKYIYEKFGVSDLMESIREVGFLKMDRMVVSHHSNECHIVIEGNRRLAAIKTLLKQVEEREIMLEDSILDTLKNIEVLVLDCDQDDVSQLTWFLQGVRHISGIRNWGPYQQAALVDSLMNEQNMSFTEAGAAVGAGRRKTGQMYRAYLGLKQMEKDDEYSDYANPDLFSHFEQAWVKTSLREWFDWDERDQEYKNLNTLKRFYKWITEDNPVSGQKKLKAQEVRDKLSLVVSSDDAREKFMQDEANLDTAYGIALVDQGGFSGWHSSVKNAIDQINKVSWTYDLSENDISLLDDLIDTINKFKDR